MQRKHKKKTNMAQNKQKSVLLGLSGGVDSSVAAFLLKKEGYKVIGAFLKCFSDTKDPITGECNWIAEKRMAQKIAAHLEIPFITLDLEKQYKKEVILPMFKSYSNGLTPNPDVACNTIIKFPWLLKEAQKKGLDFIATGHYVRVKKTKQGYDLLQGKDNNKDQSYFLYELNQSILQHCLFPIGNLKKEEVREIARKQEFPNWNKHGTSGICFVGKVNIKSFLEKKIKNKPGPILDQNGKVIGVLQFYNLFTYEFILAEGFQISSEQEVAYRFTPGEEPFVGRKMTMPEYLKIQNPK